MRIEYSYLKKFLVSNESQNKLSAIFTDLGFECEVDGNCIDFDLTPNRGDAFSLKGLARDYWAFKNQDLYKKSFSSKNNFTFKRDLKVIKEIETTACKNYHLLFVG
jgi:Phenylalanyl-tRNA synthetase beta subunit